MFKTLLLSPLLFSLNQQKGFSPLFVILLLAGAILLGVYLVQNRTTIFPFAAENTPAEVTPPTLSGTYQEPKDDKILILQEFIGNPAKGTIFCSGNKLQVRAKAATSSAVATGSATATLSATQSATPSAQTIIDCDTFGSNTSGFKCGKTPQNQYGCIKPSGSSGSGTSTTTTTSQTTTSSKAKEKNVRTLSGAFPKGDAGDFIPRSDKQELLNKYLNGEIPGTIECRDSNAQTNQGKNTGDSEKNASSLWVVPDNPDGNNKAQYIVDCSKSAIGSYKNWESVKCGKLQKGNSAQYGCIDTSLKNEGTSKSPAENYSGNKTKSDCEKAAKKEYCNDSGKFVSEKPVWKNNSCQSDITEIRNCTSSDKYKSGQSYSTGSQDGVTASNKPIVDGKISPELEKLAADCGMKADTNNELGIPFFKIATGHNLSVNREDCKELLKTQLTYFDQANQRAADKLKEQADKLGVGIVKKEDGTYALADNVDTKKTGVKELSDGIDKLNAAQKAIADCQKKSGTEQAACLEGTQKKTQSTATASQVAASKGYLAKFEKIISGNFDEGKDEMCVKADLGVAPFMQAEGIGKGHKGEEYRLLVCRKKGEDKVKWRVLLLDSGDNCTPGAAEGKDPKSKGGSSGGGGSKSNDAGDDNERRRTPQQQDGGINPVESIVLGCTTGPDALDPGSEGSKAERLTKLHPTGSGDPVFPLRINNCVTLTSNKVDEVKTILKPYIDAVNSNTANLPNCKKVDTKGGGSGGSSGSGSSSSGSSSGGSSGSSQGGASTNIREFDASQKMNVAINRGTKSCDGDFVLVEGSKSKGYDCAASGRGGVCGKVKGGDNSTIGCFKP